MALPAIEAQRRPAVLLGAPNPWRAMRQQRGEKSPAAATALPPADRRRGRGAEGKPPAASKQGGLPALDVLLQGSSEAASTAPSSSRGSSPRRTPASARAGRVVLSLSQAVEGVDRDAAVAPASPVAAPITVPSFESPMYVEFLGTPPASSSLSAPPGLPQARARVPLSIAGALVRPEDSCTSSRTPRASAGGPKVVLSLVGATASKVSLSLDQVIDGNARLEVEAAGGGAGAGGVGRRAARSGAKQAEAAAPGRRVRNRRLWVHFHLHMLAPGFDLVAGLIGRAGHRVRAIADATGAKVRIRGRGSGHLEVDGVAEAPAPLMVAVTADQDNTAGFRTAVSMVLGELQTSEERYRGFCRKHGVRIVGPCYSIGAIAQDAEGLLGELLMAMP